VFVLELIVSSPTCRSHNLVRQQHQHQQRLSSSTSTSLPFCGIPWNSGVCYSHSNNPILRSLPFSSTTRARIRGSSHCFSVPATGNKGDIVERTNRLRLHLYRDREEPSPRFDVEVCQNATNLEVIEEECIQQDDSTLVFFPDLSLSSSQHQYHPTTRSSNNNGDSLTSSLPTTTTTTTLLVVNDNTSTTKEDEQFQIPPNGGSYSNLLFEKREVVNSDGDTQSQSTTSDRISLQQLARIETAHLLEGTNRSISDDSLWSTKNKVRDWIDTRPTKVTTPVMNDGHETEKMDVVHRDVDDVFPEESEYGNFSRSFRRYLYNFFTGLFSRLIGQTNKARAPKDYRNSVSENKKISETASVDGKVGRFRDEIVPDKLSIRSLWRRRHARTLEEGIRRGRSDELSFLLDRAQIDARQGHDRGYVERTLMGIVNVLAEEIDDLDIEVNTVPNSPPWRKEVEEFRMNFSRLGFKPIRMGGASPMDTFEKKTSITNTTTTVDSGGSREQKIVVPLSLVESADEGFNRIDEDNSGTLDRDELAQALSSITALQTDRDSIEELASDLLLLYDVNGDGVVDREEYQQMIEDMAKISPSLDDNGGSNTNTKNNPFFAVKDSIQSVSQKISKRAAEVASAAREKIRRDDESTVFVDETEMGSIVLSNLKLDLRQFLFGALPLIKNLTPGGPLILEPFTATITASFSRDDVMGSFLLDAGLRRLVARALRVRVRSFRDIVDGAVFFGRRWKMTSKTAPVVEVLGLSNVEFDLRNRMIITGRARVQTSPDAPLVTNTFKVRTKIGTRKNGQVIRLVEPELAFVFECPVAIENGLKVACEAMELPPPSRPEPYYSFFPIYSPFKVDDNDGFDMGEDNCLRSIAVRNGKLRFEMSVVLRPGRFLGNHYLAFTVPQRTFIITMDRVWEGVRAARENKRVSARAKKLKEVQLKESKSSSAVQKVPTSDQSLAAAILTGSVLTSTRRARLIRTLKRNKPKPKSFFSRFVEGYTMVEREGEANNERLTTDISDWFGRQGRNSSWTIAVTEQTSGENQPVGEQ
jgi:hypothetical protein